LPIASRGRWVADDLDGVRVAELEGLAEGRLEVHVSVLGLEDKVVTERLVLTELQGRRVERVTLTRDCRGVMCPLSDANPSALICLNARCVDWSLATARCRSG
jgi:hypothetical protein